MSSVNLLMDAAMANIQAAAPRLAAVADNASATAARLAPEAAEAASTSAGRANVTSILSRESEPVVIKADQVNIGEENPLYRAAIDRAKNTKQKKALKAEEMDPFADTYQEAYRLEKEVSNLEDTRRSAKRDKAERLDIKNDVIRFTEDVDLHEANIGVQPIVYRGKSISEQLQEIPGEGGKPMSYEDEQALLELAKDPEKLVQKHVTENSGVEGFYHEDPATKEIVSTFNSNADPVHQFNDQNVLIFDDATEAYNAQEVLFGRGQIKIGEELFENSGKARERVEYLNRHNIEPTSEEGKRTLAPLRPAPEEAPVPEDLGFIGRYAPQDESAMVESAIPGLGSIEAGGAMGMFQTAMLGGAMGGALSLATGGEFGEGAVAGGIAGLGIRGVAGAIRANGASLERAMYKNVLGEGFNESMTQAERVAALRATNSDNLGFVQNQAKSMLLSDRPSMTQQSRGAIMGGAALSGMMFTSNKKDHRRGFNKHRGNRI